MTEPIHIRARKFLQEFFNDEELTTFSFDYFPQVYNNFTRGMTKNEMVLELVAYSQRRGRFDELLAALERERSQSYLDRFVEQSHLIDLAHQQPKVVRRNPRQIFLSHAHQDSEIAQQLAVNLKENGWQIWMAPDSIQPGEKWVEAINRGLAESSVFVLLLTPEAVDSRWVQSETNAAIRMEHMDLLRLIPLELKSVSAPPLWSGYQWVSFQDYRKGLKDLFSLLQSHEMSVSPLSQVYSQLKKAIFSYDKTRIEMLAEQMFNIAETEIDKINEVRSFSVEREAKEIITKADIEARAIVVAAKKQAEEERVRALSELPDHLISLAVALAYKMLGETLDEKVQRKLIAEIYSNPPNSLPSVVDFAIITSALPLTEGEKQRIQWKIAARKLDCKVDPSILGGLVIRVDDQVFDYSVSARMENQRSELRDNVISLATALAYKIVGETLDEKVHHKLISDFYSKPPSSLGNINGDFATITSALPLTEEEKERIQKMISVRNSNYMVDPSILGGLIIQIDNKVIDSSVSTRMSHIHRDKRK